MEFASHDRRSFGLAKRLLFLATLLVAFAVTGYGQSAKPNFPPSSDPVKDSSKDGSKEDPRFGSPEAEIRSKLEIKEEKKRYGEHVARAREVSQLASQLLKSYQTHQAFSADDHKHCERLEKITRRIRNDAGGENKANPDLKDIPAGLEQTLKKVSEMAEELQKLVENTPRNVVSAAVIDQANQLLGLIQLVRGTSAK